MAQRSYLARLAQPLTAADPVVWSVPRAAPDESRHAISATDPAPAGERRPTRTAAICEPAAAAIARAATPTDLPVSSPSLERNTPKPGQVPSGVAGRESTKTTVPLELPIFVTSSRQAGDHHPIDMPGIAASPDAVTPVAAAREEPTPAIVPPRSLAVPRASAPRRAATDNDGPRLHIGAIEVRVAGPSPPTAPVPVAATAAPPAERRTTTPIARGYASRFGLAQG